VSRLGNQGDDARARLPEGGDQRVVGRLHPGTPGGPERHQLRVLQHELLAGTSEELGVLGVGSGPATLDEPDAEAVDLPGDRQLVSDGEVQALLLGTVAQSGVVDVEQVAWRSAGHGVRSLFWLVVRLVRAGSCLVMESKRPPVETGGQRGGLCGSEVVALVDNDVAGLHGHESATAVHQVVRRSRDPSAPFRSASSG
jgi:hypothetical protein